MGRVEWWSNYIVPTFDFLLLSEWGARSEEKDSQDEENASKSHFLSVMMMMYSDLKMKKKADFFLALKRPFFAYTHKFNP